MKKIFLVRDLTDEQVLSANGLYAVQEITKEILKSHKNWPVVIPMHCDMEGTPFWQKHLQAKYTKHDTTFIVPSNFDGKLCVSYADLFRAGMTLYEFKMRVLDRKDPREKPKKATREEYFELFEKSLNNPRMCIFNEKLMTFSEKSQLWNPAVNALEIVKSEALMQNETRDAKFSVASINPHFFAFEATKDPEFLVDIPEWDGQDRISAMAYLVKLKHQSEISENTFSELLKEWCSLVFQRLHDPMIQNRILVLQGGQGIGKDTWTSMLVDGLGQFSIPLAVIKEDKDTFLNLHRGLIMKISEFDKTAKTEVSTLKDIITTPSTNLRAPYDKDSKLRLSRCSFISSANAENLLRDSTGNRRFLIFEIESIEYAYAGWSKQKIKNWQMQCLAEMQHLADSNYRASPQSWLEMTQYIEKQTPSDAADDIKDRFLAKYHREPGLLNGSIDRDISLTDDRISDIISSLSKETGFRYRNIKSMLLARLGVFKRANNKRFWAIRIPAIESPGTEEPQERQLKLGD